MVGHHEEENSPLMTDQERRSDDGVDVAPPLRTAAQAQAVETTSRTDRDAGHPDAPLPETNEPHAEDQNRTNSPLEIDHGDANNDSGTSTPRFLQDERSWKSWKWVPYPVRRVFKSVAKWSRGPVNPQPYRIKPFFPSVQEFPLRLVDRYLPGFKRRCWVLFFYFSLWIIIFALLKRADTLAGKIQGWGAPQTIGCGVSFWSADNGCDLDGSSCRPFNGSGFPFRCSANCRSYQVLNPRAVGDQEIVYKPFIIGGPMDDGEPENATYRGDSYICGAAIHAGIVSDKDGGCGVVELVGQRDSYKGSNHNGISTISFDSYFPLSYRFVQDVKCSSTDMRWSILALSVVFTTVLSLFTSSPALFFFPNFVAIFWTIGMAIDSPPYKTVAALFSNIIGKFLPAMFVAWVMYDKMGVRRSLGKLTAQIEKTILWLGPCWVGAMDNYTLSFIPIQRLNAHDLQQQPGAKAALSIIVIVLVVIVAFQVWFFRQEGRFLKYIRFYALLVLGIVICLVLPRLNLRIHHYVLALLLLPGTSMQTRPSLVYQGLLIGLFINGIARWGFDPILQTSVALLDDAPKGSTLPAILPPEIKWADSSNGVSNITFSWEPTDEKYIDGISVLVNDVERFRAYFEDQNPDEANFTWTRDNDMDKPEYFRFAFMDGSDSGDYTKAGTWTADGKWVDMKPGPSRVKKARSLEVREKLHLRR